MDIILSWDGAYQIGRWVHFFAGIVWIGMLYYFNFVQGEFFKEADGDTKSKCIQLLVPRALAWFRYGALFTFLSGLFMLMLKGHLAGHEIYKTSWGLWILIGSALGTIMAANVWFVIWPAQKIVIASAKAVAAGGQADPRAAEKGARALTASRTNVLFSIPMLFFMGAASHLPLGVTPETTFSTLWISVLVILGLIEANALYGKTGPLTTVKGVIHMGVLLTVLLYVVATTTI